MNTLYRFAFAAGTAASLFLVVQAKAATVTDCQQLITVVQQDLAGVAIDGNHPDRTRDSLNSKLTGAIDKLDQGKLVDALQKLQDFESAVEALATPDAKGKTKLDPADADRLVAETEDAITCIMQL